jgi:predicted GIY-YIG superfamily endonuclease
MPDYCYVYVLRSHADHQFYVGLTRNLPARLQLHSKGLVSFDQEASSFPARVLGGLSQRQ